MYFVICDLTLSPTEDWTNTLCLCITHFPFLFLFSFIKGCVTYRSPKMTEGLANPNLQMMALFSHDILVLYFECKILISKK